jgi:magnesium transporter
VLRLLTVITVIILPVTLITGIFGMNVAFPGFGTSGAFWLIVAGMVATAASLIAFFKYKRWL